MTRLWGFLTLLCSIAAAAAVCAQTTAPLREDQLKAGYLGNFIKFVEWPASAPVETLTVCFVGASSVREAFGAGLMGKSISGRRLISRELQPGDTPAGCELIYLDGAASSFQKVSAQWSDGQLWAVLTVSDEPDFAHHRGVIGLFTRDNRLRFNVNLGNARRAGLKLSAALLQLATNVEKDAS